MEDSAIGEIAREAGARGAWEEQPWSAAAHPLLSVEPLPPPVTSIPCHHGAFKVVLMSTVVGNSLRGELVGRNTAPIAAVGPTRVSAIHPLFPLAPMGSLPRWVALLLV